MAGCTPAISPSATRVASFHLVDRKKDVIVSGAFNVYPREIEDVIATCTGVSTVAVIGIPDDKWGEAVTALITVRPGEQVNLDEIEKTVRGQTRTAPDTQDDPCRAGTAENPSREGRQEGTPPPVLARPPASN